MLRRQRASTPTPVALQHRFAMPRNDSRSDLFLRYPESPIPLHDQRSIFYHTCMILYTILHRLDHTGITSSECLHIPIPTHR
jgi:hypothetical protein